MIDLEFLDIYRENIAILWIRKAITSLFYFRGYRILHPDRPWYMPKAHRFLETKISGIERVFEYGSGDSSLWFAERVKEYIAVEHDQTWHAKVTKALAERNLTNARIHYIPADKDTGRFDWQKDWPYFDLLKHPPEGPEYRKYMAAIDQYPDDHFDCIIIDGRARVACLLHALPKLSKNGIIIFDDSAIYHFQEIFTLLADWYKLNFRFGLGQTTFFARQKELLTW